MHQGTRDTYNQSAGSLSQHYDSIGPRDGDIDLAFTLAGNPKSASVLELGCGNGRDARAILRHTPAYTGIDTSEKMISIAKSKVPKANFEVADALTHDYEGPYDIIFAFALLRHIEIAELGNLLRKVSNSLKLGGILYVSSNYAETYQEVPRSDSFGTRHMHLYSPAIIQKHCTQSLRKVQEIFETVDGAEWFELALKKQ